MTTYSRRKRCTLLGWTLLHFVWQGTALAALFAALLVMSRNANVRYLLGIATLILMMAAPVVTFCLADRAPVPDRDGRDAGGRERSSDSLALDQARSVIRALRSCARGGSKSTGPHALAGPGMVCRRDVVFRANGGRIVLARAGTAWANRAASDEMYRQCLLLQRRMGLHRRIRYGQCRWLDAPAVLGWFRPIVLVTTQAMTGLEPATAASHHRS